MKLLYSGRYYMNDKYIDMQIANVKQAMKITKNYMKIATNEYQMNYLKFNYEYLKNQLRYLNSIRPTEEPNQTIPPNMIFTMEDIEQNYNGENGKPAYVVVDNVVFDVNLVYALLTKPPLSSTYFVPLPFAAVFQLLNV